MISSWDPFGFPGVLYVPAIWDVHDYAASPSDATGSNMGYPHSLPATAESNFTQ